MRSMLALALALGIGVATMVPAAFAAGEEGGQDLSSPTVTVQTDQGNPGTVAGPDTPNQMNEHETDRN